VRKRVSTQVQELGLNPSQSKAYIIGLASPELKKWLEGKEDLIAIIKTIMSLSPAFTCHESKRESAFMESAIRLVEFALGSLTNADPRRGLEKPFNLGPIWVRNKFSLDSLAPDPELVHFLGNISSFIRLRTWSPFITAVLRYISDPQTQSAVDEMIRQKEGDFLTQYLDNCAVSKDRMANNGVTYMSLDAVKTPASFEEMMRAFNDELIPAIQRGNEQEVKQVFGEVIVRFSGDNINTYERPESSHYQACSEQALLDIFADDSLNTSETTLIEVDSVMMKQLSPAFMRRHLPEANRRFGTFYQVANVANRIIVSVTQSFFTMASLGDDCLKSGKQRIERSVSYLKNLALHQATGLLSSEDYISQVAIWKASAIQTAGLNDNGLNGNINSDHTRGNFAIASRNALPEGYVINPIHEGVRGLGNTLTPGVGMKDHVTIATVALLGWDNFCRLIRLYLGREVTVMRTFLQEMKIAGAGVGKPSPLLGRPSPLLGTTLGRPSPLLGRVYYMVRVIEEDGNGNKVLTTVQAHCGWSMLRNSYTYFDDRNARTLECFSAALIETGKEDGYTAEQGFFNIVSSKHFNLPIGFDNYAAYAEHLNSDPDLIRLYSTARKQCEESLPQRQVRRCWNNEENAAIANIISSRKIENLSDYAGISKLLKEIYDINRSKTEVNHHLRTRDEFGRRMQALFDEKQKELEAIALPILQKMAGSGGVPGGMSGGMPSTDEEPPAGATVEEID
jgi:hypothetical protein